MSINRIQNLEQNRFAAPFAAQLIDNSPTVDADGVAAPVNPAVGFVMVPLGVFGFVNPFALAFFAAQAQAAAQWHAAQVAKQQQEAHAQAQAALAAANRQAHEWSRDWAEYFDTEDANFWQWN